MVTRLTLKRVLPFIGVAALTLFLYRPAMNGSFIYDDRWYIAQNPGIRTVSPVAIFLDPGRIAAPESGLSADVYRPLVALSWALDYHIWKLLPAGYHLENSLIHLLNIFLVWIIFGWIFASRSARWLAVAIFAWHPVQVQSVAWMSQRSTLASSLGMLLTLVALGTPQLLSWGRVVLGWLAFGFALFCREMAAGILVILAALDGLRDRQRIPGPVDWKNPKYIGRYGGLLLLTAGYVLMRSHLLPAWSQFSGPRNWHSDAALGVMAFSVYLGKLVWPVHLRMHYAYPEPTSWLVIGAVGVALTYAIVGVWSAFRRPRVAVALLWIFVFLIPVLQFIPIRAFAAERYLYFSVIGFAWLVGELVERFPTWRPGGWAIVGVYILLTAKLVPAWASEEALWAQSVAEDPRDGFAQATYAGCVTDPHLAEDHFRLALLYAPTDGVALSALTNLSWLALRQKDFKKAEAWAHQALVLAPNEPHALYDLRLAQQGLQAAPDQKPIPKERDRS